MVTEALLNILPGRCKQKQLTVNVKICRSYTDYKNGIFVDIDLNTNKTKKPRFNLPSNYSPRSMIQYTENKVSETIVMPAKYCKAALELPWHSFGAIIITV